MTTARRCVRAAFAGLLVLAPVAGAFAEQTAPAPEEPPSSPAELQATLPVEDAAADNLGFLEQQIRSEEADLALDELVQMVEEIEQSRHRYHDTLVTPLMLTGDAQMKLGEVDAALNSYGRARHIARVSFGLFDRRQIPLVYREADAYRALGDLSGASNREEYAYEVARKDYAEYDAELLPAIERLANFYLETRNPLPARVLFNRALRILEVNDLDLELGAVPVLRGIARSHRMERFPPIYISHPDDARVQGPQPRLSNSDLDRQYVGINTFHSGERALQRVIEIRKIHEQSAKRMDALLELADWHQMFGRVEDAATLYTHIYEQMQASELDADLFFAKPVMIYFPRPEDPRAPPVHKRGDVEEGVVELGFAVSRTGRVRDLKTLRSEPPRLMDFRVRRSMRVAVFRPRLDAGAPSFVEDQTFAYTYPYYPAQPLAPAAGDNAGPPSDGELSTTGLPDAE